MGLRRPPHARPPDPLAGRRSGRRDRLRRLPPRPDARHPVQNEQAYAVLGWLADHGAEVGVDPERLAVAGDSSGGNMATVVALLAKRRGGPQIAAQALFFPVTDAAFDTPSYERHADGPYLDRYAMQRV